jgi:hypothetical protein
MAPGISRFGMPPLAEHLGGERIHREHHDKERHAAVGKHPAHQHDGDNGAFGADHAQHRLHDRAGKARQFDQLAEYGAQQEHGKVELGEARHALHENA